MRHLPLLLTPALLAVTALGATSAASATPAPAHSPTARVAVAGSFTLSSFNVLGDSHTAAHGNQAWRPSGSVRIKSALQVMENHGVDVVGLQEFQHPQARTFDQVAGKTFQVWSGSSDTENSIAWRRSAFRFVSGTTESVPYFNGYHRRMPVVLLENRATHQQMYFLNVHNPANTATYHRQGPYRAAAVRIELATVKRLRETTGKPVFLTGDMNDRSPFFCPVARTRMLTAANGGGGIVAGACVMPQRAGIDWITGAVGTVFTRYTVDHSALVRSATDHSVVFAEVS